MRYIIKNFIGAILLVAAMIIAREYSLGLWIIPMVFPGIFILLYFNNPHYMDERYREELRQVDVWRDEARVQAVNTGYWRKKYEDIKRK